MSEAFRANGELAAACPRRRAWAVLTDPAAVAHCVPGLGTVERVDERRFRAPLRLGSGLLAMAAAVEGELTELREPDAATIVVQGRAAGTTVAATVRLALRDTEDGGTIAAWSAEIVPSGALAGLVARVIAEQGGPALERLAACLRATLEA